jgi:hypothetical protein
MLSRILHEYRFDTDDPHLHGCPYSVRPWRAERFVMSIVSVRHRPCATNSEPMLPVAASVASPRSGGAIWVWAAGAQASAPIKFESIRE